MRAASQAKSIFAITVVVGVFVSLAYFIGERHGDGAIHKTESLNTGNAKDSSVFPQKIETPQYSNSARQQIAVTAINAAVSRSSSQAHEVLTPSEERVFFAEIDFVFRQGAPSHIDRAALKPHLIKLNERGRAGVNTTLAKLRLTPQADHEVEPRLAMIDYLVYRSRFDEEARQGLVMLAAQDIPSQVPLRYRAGLIADRAEMIGGLARTDWGKAAEIIASSQDQLQRVLMSHEAFHSLIASGVGREYALAAVRVVLPDFIPAI